MSHNELLFLINRIKVKKQDSLICNLNDKGNKLYTEIFKVSFKWKIKSKKVYRIIKFNQKEWFWFNTCVDLNNEFRKNIKNEFWKLMNDSVFRKLKKIIKNIKLWSF